MPPLLRRIDQFDAFGVFANDDSAQGGEIWSEDFTPLREEFVWAKDCVCYDVDCVEDVEEEFGQAVVVVEQEELRVAVHFDHAVSHDGVM